ncbi:MAG: 4Fe-4S binding protein [Desulfomonilaceae bacterium]
MRWNRSAEETIAKVPFFIRRRVKKKVEQEAERVSAAEVTLEHIRIVQQNFLKNMEDEIKGYQLESCFGSSGCPNRIPNGNNFIGTLEDTLRSRDFKPFLKGKVNGPLKFHHEFRVSVSDCPNACSRPQVADLGIVAAVNPALSENECSQCGVCAETCIESAVTMAPDMSRPRIDFDRCLFCGHCIRACPTETLVRGTEGFRIMIGGKLGRRPRLASELPGIFSRESTFRLIDLILDFYFEQNTKGERFGEILERVGTQEIEELFKKTPFYSNSSQMFR